MWIVEEGREKTLSGGDIAAGKVTTWIVCNVDLLTIKENKHTYTQVSQRLTGPQRAPDTARRQVFGVLTSCETAENNPALVYLEAQKMAFQGY